MINTESSSSKCTCGDICNCYAGIPESGPELLALYERGRTYCQADIARVDLPKKLKASVAAQLRKLDILIQFENLKAALRTEMGVIA